MRDWGDGTFTVYPFGSGVPYYLALAKREVVQDDMKYYGSGEHYEELKKIYEKIEINKSLKQK